MSVLADERSAVAAALEAAGIQSVDHIPGRLTPPIAVVSTGSPYLAPGGTFGSHELNLRVTLIAKNGANDVQTDELDGLIEKAATALLLTNWTVGEITQPAQIDVNGTAFLSTSINVSTPITL